MHHYVLCGKSPASKAIKRLVPLLLLSSAALADDAALLRCRGIAEASARLACYDALPLTASEGKAGQAAAKQADQPLTAEQFGLEEKLAPKSEVDAIESQIPGRFEGWQPNMSIRLANGQVWQVTDGSSRIYDLVNPKVEIRRGVLGAFYLNIAGDNRTVRVRRIQ
ncbi:MAG TPA: hypothetical protein VGR65_14430 [Casimicrobiaceae bacterium]|jgi:hypothetical protein|nr:hypothetical protein [Casimicrobiaceae bacterium]